MAGICSGMAIMVEENEIQYHTRNTNTSPDSGFALFIRPVFRKSIEDAHCDPCTEHRLQ